MPTSRGGTGANITPVSGSFVKSTSSGFALTSSILIPAANSVVLAAGTTVLNGAPLYIPAGSTMGTKMNGAIESNGTNLYWTDGSGNRYKFTLILQ